MTKVSGTTLFSTVEYNGKMNYISRVFFFNSRGVTPGAPDGGARLLLPRGGSHPHGEERRHALQIPGNTN